MVFYQFRFDEPKESEFYLTNDQKNMITKYTSDIFEILRRGQFICSNSPEDTIQTLYKILEDGDTFEVLYNYFYQINYILEEGDEYFYRVTHLDRIIFN